MYGDYASPQVNFGEIFVSDTELIKVVGSMPRVTGTPSLEKALEAAKDQFESPYIRPNAAKVTELVVSSANNAPSKHEIFTDVQQ